MDTKIRVREAMTASVIVIKPTTPVNEAAKIMSEKNIGSVVVSEGSKPIGIITERDICYGVVALNRLPSKVAVKEIMSTPLTTIDPNKTLTEASRTMAKNNIRRLPVIENDVLVGIITNKDILTISPGMIEILEEISRMREGSPYPQEPPEGGICEVCREYVASLYEVNGSFVCENCREDTLGGE